MYDISSSHIRRGFSVLLVQAVGVMLEPWVAGRVTDTDSRAISFLSNIAQRGRGAQKNRFIMKHLFRFLCVVTMLCYSISGFSETAHLWVGDSHTFTDNHNNQNSVTYGGYDFYWEYSNSSDQQYFSLTTYPETNGINTATVTLKQFIYDIKEK